MEQEALLALSTAYALSYVLENEGCVDRNELTHAVRLYAFKESGQDVGLGFAGKLVAKLVSSETIVFRQNPDDLVKDCFFGHDRRPKAYMVRK